MTTRELCPHCGKPIHPNEDHHCDDPEGGMSFYGLLRDVADLEHHYGICYREAMSEFRRAYIETALRRAGDNQCEAARAIGVHRNTLARLMDEVGLVRKRGNA